MSAGPPLFPGLMAASIWMARSCAALWACCVGSTRETTPVVIEMLRRLGRDTHAHTLVSHMSLVTLHKSHDTHHT